MQEHNRKGMVQEHSRKYTKRNIAIMIDISIRSRNIDVRNGAGT